MKPFQVTRYLKKWTLPIAVLSVLAGVILYAAVTLVFQKYNAEMVINYPEGTEVDTSEIYASNIISEAMDNLGVDKNITSTDAIRANVSVSPVLSQDEQTLKEALLQDGQTYDYQPTSYLVTYTADVSEGKEFARQMLNEIVNVYLGWYGENYINTTGGANAVSDIYNKEYDYIEMMDLIDDFLDSSMDSISKKISIDGGQFRSYKTGYSFNDLYNEFNYIKYNVASFISADILNDRITKNRDVLLSKYEKRNSDMASANAADLEEIENIKNIINSYVTMMSESGNTNITSEYILNDINSSYYIDEKGNVTQGDVTVQYDRLLDGYVADRTEYESNLLDTAYNSYVLEIFSRAAQSSSQTAQDEIQSRITALVDRLNNLYEIYNTTNDEFNDYLGATTVSTLSSIGVSERIPALILAAATIFVFGLLGCGGAIAAGRVGDIMDYYAFTDKVDGLPNRASCDNYLSARERKVLFGDFTAVIFKITNLADENSKFGRETGNSMMKDFVRIVTDVFAPSDDVFVGNNGAGQYMVFAKGCSREQAVDNLGQINEAVKLSNANTQYQILYKVGLAEAATDRCYNIRKLLSLAIKNLGVPSGIQKNQADPSAPMNAADGSDAASDETAAQDTAYAEKKVVNYGSAPVYTLGSDYYTKFKNARNKK